MPNSKLMPRTRTEDKRWDMTVKIADKCLAIGYCTGTGVPAGNGDVAYANKYHDDGHSTAEEARRCFREFELDNTLVFVNLDEDQAQEMHRCATCKQWTKGWAQFGVMAVIFWLCEPHQTREVVSCLLPPPDKINLKVVDYDAQQNP